MKIALRIISSFSVCSIALLFAPSAAAQSQWQRLYPSPTPQQLLGVTYANGLFVAVGANNTILTSPDAVDWTLRSGEGDSSLTEIAHGNGMFVAVGRAGDCEGPATALRTSSDGLTWHEQPALLVSQPASLVFANNLFIGVGTTETPGGTLPTISTSSDGRDWTERWRGKVQEFAGEYLVAEGQTTLAVITARTLLSSEPAAQIALVSTNGREWNEIPFLDEKAKVLRVVTGAGRFVAIAHAVRENGAELEAWTSGDGASWQRHVIQTNWQDHIYGVAFAKEEFIILARNVDSQSQFYMLRSADGQLWSSTPVTGLRDDNYRFRLSINHLNPFLYAKGQFVWADYQQSMPGPRVFISPDGTNWMQTVGVSRIADRVASDGRSFVAWLGASVRESSNGKDWHELQVSTNVVVNSLLYGQNVYVAAGESGIFTSPDGRAWNQRTNAGTGWSRLRLGTGTFLAVGAESDDSHRYFKLATSTNATDWNVERVSDSFETVGEAATDGKNSVVAAFKGTEVLLGSSGDGVWKEVYRPPSSHALYPLLAYGNRRFVAFNTAINSVLISADGTRWTEHFVRTENGFNDLIFASGQFYAAANGLCSGEARVLSSYDGVTWTEHSSGFFGLFQNIAAAPQGLIGFSSYNQILLFSPWDITLGNIRRLPNGTAQFSVSAGSRSIESLEIQAASRFSPSDWKTIPVSRDNSNPAIATDAGDLSQPHRFYRAIVR